ncbi:MAG TPA: hypothetical protein VHV10_15705 [Ktedonobacteraceae bacterium]|jgi:hypothetical protein|nr:hypothetical protein [Ktedonobacteraceae bacterium]
MRTPDKLKIILVCYAFYMLGGGLSAWLVETNNRTDTIVAIVLPTLIGMLCITLLTQQVQSRKKKRLPARRNVRIAR